MGEVVTTYSARDTTAAAVASAKRGIGSVENAAEKANSVLARFGVVLSAGAIVTGIVALARAGADAADRLSDLSGQLGLSEKALAGYSLQAKLAGVEQGTLEQGIIKFTENLSKAQTGTGEAAAAFQQLGLDARHLKEIGLDAAIAETAQRISELGDKSDQTASTIGLFGGRGKELTRIMQDGAAGIAQARAEVERYGVALSSIEHKDIQKANDELDRAKVAALGLGAQIAATTAPLTQFLADTMIGLAGAAADVVREFRRAGDEFGLWKRKTEGLNFKDATLEIADFSRQINALDKQLKEVQSAGPIRIGLEGLAKAVGVEGENEAQIRQQNLMADITAKIQELELARAAVIERANALIASENTARESSLGLALQLSDADKASLAAKEKSAALEQERIEKKRTDAGDKQLEDVGAAAEKAKAVSDAAVAADQQSLEALRSRLDSEATLENQRHVDELAEIDRQLALKNVKEQQANRLSENENKRHQDALKAIDKAAAAARTGFMGSFFSTIGTLAQGAMSNLFQNNKKAAIAGALVDTGAAVVKTLASIPYPANLAAAAHVALVGLGQVAAIAAVSLLGGGGGGGGSISSAAASAGTTSSAPSGDAAAATAALSNRAPGNPLTSGAVVHLEVHGSIVGTDRFVVDTLADALTRAINERDVTIIGSGSRQAQDLIAAAQA